MFIFGVVLFFLSLFGGMAWIVIADKKLIPSICIATAVIISAFSMWVDVSAKSTGTDTTVVHTDTYKGLHFSHVMTITTITKEYPRWSWTHLGDSITTIREYK